MIPVQVELLVEMEMVAEERMVLPVQTHRLVVVRQNSKYLNDETKNRSSQITPTSCQSN